MYMYGRSLCLTVYQIAAEKRMGGWLLKVPPKQSEQITVWLSLKYHCYRKLLPLKRWYQSFLFWKNRNIFFEKGAGVWGGSKAVRKVFKKFICFGEPRLPLFIYVFICLFCLFVTLAKMWQCDTFDGDKSRFQCFVCVKYLTFCHSYF